MKTLEINRQKAGIFAEKLLTVINNGSLSLMISIGHRTGLFDIMGEMEAATYQKIAGKGNLNERYVKEWLGAMVTGKIVEYDPKENTYSLPAEHSQFLSRKSGADNMGVFSQYISVLGSVENEIIECFYNGGGVQYENFNRFHEVMAEDSGQSVLSSLKSAILPMIPGIEQKLREGIDVLDIGCGRGKAMIWMAENYPYSRFVGIDLCEEPILRAREESDIKGLSNLTFKMADLTYYKPDKQYDLITAFDAIHDQARPDKILSLIYQMLKSDGVFLMQDIDASSYLHENMDHPLGVLLYSISTMHCMTVSLAQNGMGLGTMWGTELAEKMIKEAGFTNIEIKRLPHDIQNCYYIIRK